MVFTYDFNVEKHYCIASSILSILSTEENEDTFMNLEEWFASNSHVVHNLLSYMFYCQQKAYANVKACLTLKNSL